MAAVPTTAYIETTPVDDQNISTVDDLIRILKTQFREVFAIDHIASSSGSGATWGMHNKATIYELDDDPDAVVDGVVLYQKAVSAIPELFFIKEDGDTMQLTSDGQFIGGIVGEVRIFQGLETAIPVGWEICDGTDDKPDLLGRFIKGTPTVVSEPKVTDGTDTVTMTSNIMPTHSHTLSFSTDDVHTHTYTFYSQRELSIVGGASSIYAWLSNIQPDWGEGDSVHIHTASLSNNTSANTAFSILPSYFEAVFIIKT